MCVSLFLHPGAREGNLALSCNRIFLSSRQVGKKMSDHAPCSLVSNKVWLKFSLNS